MKCLFLIGNGKISEKAKKCMQRGKKKRISGIHCTQLPLLSVLKQRLTLTSQDESTSKSYLLIPKTSASSFPSLPVYLNSQGIFSFSNHYLPYDKQGPPYSLSSASNYLIAFLESPSVINLRKKLLINFLKASPIINVTASFDSLIPTRPKT